MLVQESKRRVPNLDEDLTAYGPIEGEEMTHHPKVLKHYKKIENYDLPKKVRNVDKPVIVCFFPCSARKPYYKSLEHRAFFRLLKEKLQYREMEKGILQRADVLLYVAVISEPLGVVPYEYVKPGSVASQYDCPAFFTEVNNGKPVPNNNRITPWKTGETEWTEEDTEAWLASIKKFAEIVAYFIENTKSIVTEYLDLTKKDVHREVVKRGKQITGVEVHEISDFGDEWVNDIEGWKKETFQKMGRKQFIHYLQKKPSKSKREILDNLRKGKITLQKAIEKQAKNTAEAYKRRANLAYNNPVMGQRLRKITANVS